MLITASIFVLQFTKLVAQVPCYPDCPNCTWIGPNIIAGTINDVCSGCLIEVRFYKRICIDGNQTWYDTQIDQVIALTSQCENCNYNYIQEGLKLIWSHPELTGFPVLPDSCLVQFRATTGECWRVNHSDEPFAINYEVCPGDTTCCLASYKICWNSDSSIKSIDIISTVVGAKGYCDDDSCNESCDKLAIKWEKGHEQGKISANLQFNNVNLKPSSDGISIKECNSSYITIISNIMGETKVIISDILGNIVFCRDLLKNILELQVQINSKNLTNGLYFYYINIDGTNTKSGIINCWR